jgi:hypothetical protein
MTVNTLKSMKNKFTYDQLMQWDKNDLAEQILKFQHEVQQIKKFIENYE